MLPRHPCPINSFILYNPSSWTESHVLECWLSSFYIALTGCRNIQRVLQALDMPCENVKSKTTTTTKPRICEFTVHERFVSFCRVFVKSCHAHNQLRNLCVWEMSAIQQNEKQANRNKAFTVALICMFSCYRILAL